MSAYINSLIEELRRELEGVRVPIHLLQSMNERQGADQNGVTFFSEAPLLWPSSDPPPTLLIVVPSFL